MTHNFENIKVGDHIIVKMMHGFSGIKLHRMVVIRLTDKQFVCNNGLGGPSYNFRKSDGACIGKSCYAQPAEGEILERYEFQQSLRRKEKIVKDCKQYLDNMHLKYTTESELKDLREQIEGMGRE